MFIQVRSPHLICFAFIPLSAEIGPLGKTAKPQIHHAAVTMATPLSDS